jgi:hypothetical protein
VRRNINAKGLGRISTKPIAGLPGNYRINHSSGIQINEEDLYRGDCQRGFPGFSIFGDKPPVHGKKCMIFRVMQW